MSFISLASVMTRSKLPTRKALAPMWLSSLRFHFHLGSHEWLSSAETIDFFFFSHWTWTLCTWQHCKDSAFCWGSWQIFREKYPLYVSLRRASPKNSQHCDILKIGISPLLDAFYRYLASLAEDMHRKIELSYSNKFTKELHVYQSNLVYISYTN